MPYHGTPEVKRAKQARYRYKNGVGTAPHLGERWSTLHTQLVLAHSIPDTQLAKEIGRSVLAISVHRFRQKQTQGDYQI